MIADDGSIEDQHDPVIATERLACVTLVEDAVNSVRPSASPNASMLSEEQFERIAKVIQQYSGIRLAPRNALALSSRVDAGLRDSGLDDVDAYCRRISSAAGSDLRDRLIESVTVNETSFFRTLSHFEWFERKFLDGLQSRGEMQGPRTLRIWSAACSTGAEAYSIAMVLAHAGLVDAGWDVRLLASDLSTRWLDVAKRATYGENRLGAIPSRYRRMYLSPSPMEDGRFVVDEKIKAMVHWVRHNLIEPPPRTGEFDLVWLRNVMIYFDDATRKRVLANVIASMRPGGYLVVGPSEGIYGIHQPLRKLSTFLYQREVGP